jgi:hypothetical protein
VPGRAARWRAGEELTAKLEAVGVGEVGEGVVVAGVDGLEAVGPDEVKEREEEKSTLYGHNQTQVNVDQLVIDRGDSSNTISTHQTTTTTPDQGQSASFRRFLDDFGLWLPVPRPRFAGYSIGKYRMAA